MKLTRLEQYPGTEPPGTAAEGDPQPLLILVHPTDFICFVPQAMSSTLIILLCFLPSWTFQLSLRRQQVSERLNEWAVFSEKNKELCEWLTQMESKVSQNGDILIEEMIEKLRKVTDVWLHVFIYCL